LVINFKIKGQGKFGIIRTATLKNQSKKIYAIKTIKKSKLKRDFHLLSRELAILRSMIKYIISFGSS